MPQSTIPLTQTPESSQIAAYGYDANTQRLAVKYKTNGDRFTYEYKGVPPALAEAMEAADSKGSFIYRTIKPTFDFDRMEEPEAERSAD